MGSLHKYQLDIFPCDVFFETGTGTGNSLEFARGYPFELLYSAEIDESTAVLASKRFAPFAHVKILQGDSVEVLEKVLPSLDQKSRCLFFLDAHFPGEMSDQFVGYSNTEMNALSLPLERELEIIRKYRPHCRDVIIIDDLRIYEDCPFRHGNLPPEIPRLPEVLRDVDFVKRIFPDRAIKRNYRDEGYLLIYPNGLRLDLVKFTFWGKLKVGLLKVLNQLHL